jgi:hypothetical protein
LSAIAARIEQSFPAYQDRLRSTIDILSGKEVPGSEMMKQRVVSETARLSQTHDINSVIVVRPILYTSAAGIAALLLLGVLIGMAQPEYIRIARARLLSPFSANPWPKQVIIEQIGELPKILPIGQRLDVNIRLSRGQSASRKAVIFYQYGDESGRTFGPLQQEYMTRVPDGSYHASIDALAPQGAPSGTLKVWMESGDDRKDLHLVKIVQRLAINRFEAVITPPLYANLPANRVNLIQNPLSMTAGSKVQLTAVFNKPLNAANPVSIELLTPKVKPIFQWRPAAGDTVTAMVDAPESFRFRLHAVDADGFSNTAAEEYEFAVRPDQLPKVLIENPRGNEDRTPDSIVPLQILAEDDFGVQAITLVVDRIGDKKHWEIPLVRSAAALAGIQWNQVDSTSELRRFRASLAWDLSALQNAQLHSGDVLEYYTMVKDNYEYNGDSHAPVASGKLRITIISQDEFTNEITDALTTAAEQAGALKKTQMATQLQTQQLAKEIAGKSALDPADKAAADRLASQEGTIASQTKSLSQSLTELQSRIDQNKSTDPQLKDTAREVGDLLNSAAENSMKDAVADLNTVRDSSAKSDRNKSIGDALSTQATAGDALQKALDRMGNVGSLSRSMEALQQLLTEQQKLSADTATASKNNIGKSRSELSPQDRQKLDDLAKQQAELAAKTSKVLKEMALDAKKLAKSDPAAAAAMKQAADTAKSENVAGNQSKAAKSMQQNQQSQVQSAQKQAEEGMQKMQEDLRDAEKQELQALSEQLADIQQRLNAIVRQQAGHNLDNLNLQGHDVLQQIDAQVRADLFQNAERDPGVPMPPIEIGMLSSLQEQTEHNTRDIAKAVADMSKGAEPADHLTEAADKMDRAIISLRNQNLIEAYNPAQTEALALILQAKKLIDDQKGAVDQQQDDQKKQSVKQVYVTLLAQQKELDSQTIEIDSAPRNDDGTLARADALKLSQLSFSQGKLAETAAKIDSDLATLGSVVYSFANRDLVKNMQGVKDLLAAQQTGAVAQSLQMQVEQELSAMIRDLTLKPKNEKFAQSPAPDKPGGGGGGGPPPPGMPGESELRLIRDLQRAENQATVAAAQQLHPNKDLLRTLAGRQGDLRNLVDRIFQNSSHGAFKLPPEPDPHDQLPEESPKAVEKVEDQELENDLIGSGKTVKSTGKAKSPAGTPGNVKLIGDRMGRARQRLANDGDCGPVTQAIQNRIIDSLDELIQASSTKPPPPPPPPSKSKPTTQPKTQPKPSSGAQPENSEPPKMQAKSRSKDSGQAPQDDKAVKPPQTAENPAKEQGGMWGTVTPRERDAIIESQNEKVLDKYKNLVDDYYRTMSGKTDGQ